LRFIQNRLILYQINESCDGIKSIPSGLYVKIDGEADSSPINQSKKSRFETELDSGLEGVAALTSSR
jgi:hypothetical protein